VRPGGAYTHISFSDADGSMRGVDLPAQAVAVKAARGLFHLRVAGLLPPPDEVTARDDLIAADARETAQDR
jgi:hypothetical protein